ncbi:hypothetical protein [Algoriphagus namhaensis]
MSLPKKAKNRNVFLTILLVLTLAVGGIFLLSEYLETKLAEVLRGTEQSTYEITFDELALHLWSASVEVNGVRIIPKDPTLNKMSIQGNLKALELQGLGVWKFLLNKELYIEELVFDKPEFELAPNTETEPVSDDSAIQSLFKDVISRGTIRNFRLIAGTLHLTDTLAPAKRVAGISNWNIYARGISTDSIRWTYAIPFEFDHIESSFEDFYYQIDSLKRLSLGSFKFDYSDNSLELQDLALTFSAPWRQVARAAKFQGDIIDFEIKSIRASGLSATTTFFDSLKFVSQKVEIDSLILHDGRDKNLPRPPEERKKNFASLMKELPVPLEIDTLLLTHSQVKYAEINQGSSEPGIFTLSQIDAQLTNITSIRELQDSAPLVLDLTATANQSGKVQLKLVENYATLDFDLDAHIRGMDMRDLNATLVNLTGIRVESGSMADLHLQMKGGLDGSQNKFSVRYQNLDLAILNGKDKRPSALLKPFTGLMYKKNHQPDQKNYKEPSYYTRRNVYRGPINLVWNSMKDGLMRTVPSGAAQMFIEE